MMMRRNGYIAVVLLAGLLVSLAAAAAFAADDGTRWRIRLHEAAVVEGPRITLGEIADIEGNLDRRHWKQLASTELWSAPDREGRPLSISRPRLQKAMRKYLDTLEHKVVYPGSMAVQRGGKVLLADELNERVVEALTPHLSRLPGEPVLREVRLPEFVFLRDEWNTLEVDDPTTMAPGRISIHLREVDSRGETVRRITGGAFLDVWATVPCAAHPLNRYDTLTPQSITHVRKNLAYVGDGELWDGKGGPWRVIRSIGTESVIYRTDIERVPMMQKGERVSLVFRGKNLRLTVPAEAEDDGKPGDLIPVRNLQSKRQVYATVVDPDTVIIER